MNGSLEFEHLPLTYGSVVYLSPQGDSDVYIYSDGFVKTTLSLRNSSKGRTGGIFDRCLFKIYPSFHNSVKKEALNIQEVISRDTITQARKQEIAEDLKDRLFSEFKFNLDTYEKAQGKLIPFDQPIQFLHVASNKFLSLLNQEAELEREHFKLELVDYPSEWTVFKFVPSFKHQKESNGVIYSGDYIYIANTQFLQKKIPFINSTKIFVEDNQSSVRNVFEDTYHQSPEFYKNVRLVQSRNDLDVRGPENRALMNKREVNASLECSMRWQIFTFAGPAHDQEEYLSYGDVVWINNAESNCTLVTKMEINQVPTIEFIKAAPTDNFQHYVGHTNGMWVLEHKTLQIGGLVRWDHCFRLKNVTSGLYLSARKDANMNYFVTSSANDHHHDLWRFVPVPSASLGKDPSKARHYIPKDAFILIQAEKSTRSPQSPRQVVTANTQWFLRSQNPTPTLDKTWEEQDICKIDRANMNEVWETNFLVSCFPRLKNYVGVWNDIRKNQHAIVMNPWLAQKLEHKVQKVMKTLNILRNFCTNKILISSFDQKFGQPNIFRQKLLREQYFITVLIEILAKSMTIEEIEKYGKAKVAPAVALQNKRRKTLAQIIRKKIIHGNTDQREQFSSLIAELGEDNPIERKIIEMKADVIKEVLRLLPKICEGNQINKKNLFYLVPRIKFLIKYFEEATNFLIQIIQDNEDLLIEISEDWKYDLTSDPEKRFLIEDGKDDDDTGEMETLKSIKKIEMLGMEIVFGARKSKKKTFASRVKTTHSINNNLIHHYMKILNDNANRTRFLHFLKFFRCLSCFEEKGMSINQEIFFNIFKTNEQISRNLFIPTKIMDGDLLINMEEDHSVDINSCFKEGEIVRYRKELGYFQEQLRFYSDLLLNRNYLWKAQLEKEFPVEFVFKQIYNENLSLSMRAVFCQLVVSLYIDHEPLNEIPRPSGCRVFKRRSTIDETHFIDISRITGKGKSNENYEIMQELFSSSLFEEIWNIINTTKTKIREQLQEKCQAVSDANRDAKIHVHDFLNNELIQRIAFLLLKAVSFDVFRILKKPTYYPRFVRELLGLLEYDQTNPALTYLVINTRELNFEKIAKAQKKNKMLSALTTVVSNVADIGKGLASIVTSTVFGKQKRKAAEKSLGEANEDKKLINNPLMKGLLSLIYHVDGAAKEKISENHEVESKIKEYISEILLLMISQRQDFLIQNFLCWFDDILIKEGKRLFSSNIFEVNESLMMSINSQSLGVIPPITKTGIAEVDEKYAPKNTGVFEGVKTFMKSVGKKKMAKILSFTNFTGSEEFPDLDRLAQDINPGSSKQRGMEILPSLLVTFLNTDDTKLEHSLLDIIMRCFSQREELGGFLKDIDVLFDNEDIAVYSKMKTQVEDVRFLVERSEIWLAEYANKGGKAEELEEIIQHFNEFKGYFIRTKKKKSINPATAASTDLNNPLYKAIMKQRGGGPPIVELYVGHQNIFRNLKGHEAIFELLQNGMFHLKRAFRQDDSPPEIKEKLAQLFETAYECLTYFCKENEANQLTLSEKMKLFLSNLDYDLGQIQLICEICKDNRYVCENYGELILTTVLETIEKHGRRAVYLEPLMHIQTAKGVDLIDNQFAIFNKLLPNFRALEFKEEEILYAREREPGKDLQFLFKKNDHTPEILIDKVHSEHSCDEPGIYHAKLLEVFLAIARGNEKLQFSHARLRKAFPLIYLLELLNTTEQLDHTQQWSLVMTGDEEHESFKSDPPTQKSEDIPRPTLDQMNYIRNKLLELIGVIYLESDYRMIPEWEKAYESLATVLVAENKKIAGLNEKTPNLALYLQYIFDEFLPFLVKYVDKIFLNSRHTEINEKLDLQLFNDIIFSLCNKMLLFPKSYRERSINDLTVLARTCFDDQTYKSVFAEKIQAIENKKQEFLDIQKAISVIRKTRSNSQAKGERGECPTRELWKRFVYLFLNSKAYLQEVEKEKMVLSEAIINFDKYFPEEMTKKYKLQPITIREIVKKFIKYLKQGVDSEANPRTMIRTMEVLIKIIEQSPDKQLIQDFMNKEEAMEMILSVLSDPNNLKIQEELLDTFLKFGIALMEGGNRKVQKTIYDYCVSFPRSEIMFKRLYTLIQNQIDKLKADAQPSSEDLFDNSRQGTQFFLFQLEEENSDDRQDLNEKIVEKILRFLQLFTEGHYLELQNYVRFQKNNFNSYDLVAIITELLLTYSSNMTQKIYENILKCLDTLTEFVQGPCPENQISLIDGKFLEVAYKILSRETKAAPTNDFVDEETLTTQMGTLMTSPGAKNPRKSLTRGFSKISRNSTRYSDLQPWQIAQLKYKCMILLNSLWESRQTPKTVGRIMRSIPLDILKKNIAEIYKQYKDMYKDSLTEKAYGHYASSPDKDEENKPPEYYELILETGFYIYFLIQTYIGANVQDSDIDFIDEIHEINDELQFTKTVKGAGGLLRNNVIGDLGKFGVTLLKSGFSTVSCT